MSLKFRLLRLYKFTCLVDCMMVCAPWLVSHEPWRNLHQSTIPSNPYSRSFANPDYIALTCSNEHPCQMVTSICPGSCLTYQGMSQSSMRSSPCSRSFANPVFIALTCSTECPCQTVTSPTTLMG